MRPKHTSERSRRRQSRKQDFYEVMPGTFSQPYGTFPRSATDTKDTDMLAPTAAQQAETDQLRSRMIRQGLLLLGLLLIQIILFAALITSTVNLG